jgi:hypothetical protein
LLSSIFEMKDMGHAYYVLGVKIQKDQSKIVLSLSQENFIKRILEWFCICNSKLLDTPIVKSHALRVKKYPKTKE